MPSKSRHGRGKYSQPAKKRKEKRTSLPTAIEPSVATQTNKPSPPVRVTTPSVSMPAPMPTPAPAKYPYVTDELRRIGILAGIMVAVLIILSFTLP